MAVTVHVHDPESGPLLPGHTVRSTWQVRRTVSLTRICASESVALFADDGYPLECSAGCVGHDHITHPARHHHQLIHHCHYQLMYQLIIDH